MNEKELTMRWIEYFLQEIPTFYIEELYRANMDDWEEVTIGHEDDEDFNYYALPIWADMYRFDNVDGRIWIENHIKEVSECGFRIYYWRKYDEYVFGINGCGYNFMEAHWIPLFRKWKNS